MPAQIAAILVRPPQNGIAYAVRNAQLYVTSTRGCTGLK